MLLTNTWIKDYVIIIVTISLLYGLFLGARPLTPPDEARYSEIPREMIVNHDYVTPRLNGIKYFEKPALFYWLQTLSIKSFGLNEWSLRSTNALMALLGCVLTYWGARRLYNRNVGLIASFVLGSSVLYAGMSQFITLDMTVSVFLTGGFLSFLLGVNASNRERRYLFWLMYAFFALATLTKGLIGFIIPGAIIFMWLAICSEWQQLKKCYLVSGSLLFLMITLPWHILVQLKNPEFFHFYFIEQHFFRYFTDYAHREQAIWFLPMVLLLGFFPWVGFLYNAIKFNCPTWRERKLRKREVFFCLWVVIIFVFYWKSHSQLAPYILPVFPPLAIMTARYLNHYWQKQSVGPKFGFRLSLAISVALLFAAMIFVYQHPEEQLNIVSYSLYGGLLLSLSSFATAFVCNRRNVLLHGFPFLVLGAGFLITTMNLNYMDQRSVKSLAETLHQIRSPVDQIVSYHTYYQDLPFYLRNNIQFTHFRGELEFGMNHQNVDKIVINDEDLWKAWHSQQRIFMILKQDDYNSLLKNKELSKHFVLSRTSRNILITNQETKS